MTTKTAVCYQVAFPAHLTEEHQLARARVHHHLEKSVDWRLMCVTARPGQGKSSFVAFYTRRMFDKSLWFTARRPDNGGQEVDATGIASEVASTLAGEEDSVLVLDDLWAVNGDAGAFVRDVFQRLPGNVRVVAISRWPFDVTLPHLYAGRRLVTIDDDDLRVAADEIDPLFQAGGIHISRPNWTQELDALVDGWIAGYVLLQRKLERMEAKFRDAFLHGFVQSARLREIDEFFREEVLGAQDVGFREFFYHLAGLDEISVRETVALGVPHSLDYLEIGARRRLFIDRGTVSRSVFVVEPMLQKFLIREFDTLGDSTRYDIARRVADVIESERTPPDAIRYLLVVHQYEQATALFLTHADQMYRDMDLDEFRGLVEAFPEETRREHRNIGYYHALGSSIVKPASTAAHFRELLPGILQSGEFEKAANIYSVLLVTALFYHRSDTALTEISDEAVSFLERYGGKISAESRVLLDSVIPLGQWFKGDQTDATFETALTAEETFNRQGNSAALICARLVLSRIYLEKGLFAEAERILQRTDAFCDVHQTSGLFRALLAFHVGDTHFYLGEIGTAVDRIERELKSCPEEFAFRYFLELNLVFYSLYREDAGPAEALFRLAVNREIEENAYVRYFSEFLIPMLIAYRNGDRYRARFFAERLSSADNVRFLGVDFPYGHLALAEVFIFLEECDRARLILAPFVSDDFVDGHPYPAATAFALMTVIEQRLGNAESRNRCSARMTAIVEHHQYTNLDIVNPSFLNDVATMSGAVAFSAFPRLNDLDHANGDDREVVKICTLGTFRLVVHGKDITDTLTASQKRATDLLKLLTIHRKRGIPKERVYEVFWPRYSYKSARDNLNTILYRLRKLLGESASFLITDQPILRFRNDLVLIDVDHFEDVARRGLCAFGRCDYQSARDLLERAHAEYRGGFLEEEIYLDFVREQREEFRALHGQALFVLAKTGLTLGDYSAAIDWARQLIASDSVCEPAFRLLMIASALSGNRGAVPRHYDRLASNLQNAFGITPDERTTELKTKLLSNGDVEEQLWMSESHV